MCTLHYLRVPIPHQRPAADRCTEAHNPLAAGGRVPPVPPSYFRFHRRIVGKFSCPIVSIFMQSSPQRVLADPWYHSRCHRSGPHKQLLVQTANPRHHSPGDRAPAHSPPDPQASRGLGQLHPRTCPGASQLHLQNNTIRAGRACRVPNPPAQPNSRRHPSRTRPRTALAGLPAPESESSHPPRQVCRGSQPPSPSSGPGADACALHGKLSVPVVQWSPVRRSA